VSHTLQGSEDAAHALALGHHLAEPAGLNGGLHIGLCGLRGEDVLSKEQPVLADLDLIPIVQGCIESCGSATDLRAVPAAIRQAPTPAAAA